MWRTNFRLLSMIIATGLVGCGRTTPPPTTANNSAPTEVVIPSSMNGTTQVVQASADDSMHFNGNHFTVKSGQPVRIELTNKGHRPREDMAHNLVILKPGTDVMSFNLLSAQAKATGYTPANHIEDIIAQTNGLAGPGETVVAEFTAPAPGEYPFLCNFPGHYILGMHGTMTVVP